ncbi:MAG: nucleotidyltransferase domain-containing protein [Chitinophagaceae bacterium]|nr:nucleotidyltransferase domain-containing protein [Chitinophagaceae bacterium]
MTIDELKNNGLLLFECIAGSKAFGLSTPTSDTDIKGVFYMPKHLYYGIEYIPQISNETNDIVYYELGRFVELLIKNNPNILEILATPDDCILYKHPVMDHLSIDFFLSKLCRDTFAGYALTQIKKARGLNKKIVNPLPEERRTVPDFCYIIHEGKSFPLNEWLVQNHYKPQHCGLIHINHTKGLYAVYYDHENTFGYKGIMRNDDANDLSLSSIPKGEKEIAYLFFNIENYSMYCKEYKEYWDWVIKRNENRFQLNEDHGKNYDAKNMMHTIRLLQVAEEILRDGKLTVRRSNREELLSIKRGEWDYEVLLTMADKLTQRINDHYEACELQLFPDAEKAIATVVKMRQELYK